MENLSNSPNMDTYMLEKKFEIMIDMNNKKISNEISKLSSTVSRLNEELASIRKEMGRGNSAETANQRANQSQAQAAVQETMEYGVREIPSNSVRPKPNEDVKPRFGDYSPEDVPIGKIFYFGNKKAR